MLRSVEKTNTTKLLAIVFADENQLLEKHETLRQKAKTTKSKLYIER